MTTVAQSTVLITGASSGIGAAVARAAASRSARVVLVARRGPQLRSVADSVANGEVHEADASDPESVRALFESLQFRDLVPDVLVNAAGLGRWRFLDRTEPDELIAMTRAPLLAALLMTRAALPGMLARGRGHIVNITSAAAFMTWPGATAYTANRWAIRGLHEALRADLVGTGVVATLATFAKVRSGYWEHNPGSEERIPAAQASIPEIDPDQAATAILAGIEREREHVVEPAALRRLLRFNRWFPGLVRERLHVAKPRSEATLG